MKWWNRLLRFCLGDDVIHSSVRNDDIESIYDWLDRGFDINAYELGMTPLQLSLLEQHHRCTLFLLQRGANSNMRCYSKMEEWRGQTIQPFLIIHLRPDDNQFIPAKEKNESIIRLLTLYGATNVNFSAPAIMRKRTLPSFQKVYNETQQFLKIGRDLDYVVKHRPPPAAYEACRELKKMWQELSEKETNEVFKAHYQRVANWYEYQALERRKKLQNEEKTTPDFKCSIAVNHVYSSPIGADAYFTRRHSSQEQKTPAATRDSQHNAVSL